MKKLTIIAILSCLLFAANAQDHHVRFGFLGNSITIGAGLTNPTEECYPSQLAGMLKEKYGDTCIVGNYAVSGRTMLKNGDFPLWDEDDFKTGWFEAPDICFICLGTNDTKPQNWDDYGNEFHSDYLAMMDTFKVRNPYVKFIVCYPPPAFEVVWSIRNEIIVDGVIPVVDSVLDEREALLVDYYNPLLDSEDLFPDKIHPSAEGSKVMAQIAFDRIVEADIIHQVSSTLAFITKLETETEDLPKGDSVSISWNSRNANEVFFNGETVNDSGSIKVAPQTTTDYWVVAKGNNNTDSVKLTQTVYIPELDTITVYPKKSSLRVGQERDFKITYYDQLENKMVDTVFAGEWYITEGDGELKNVTDTMVTFHATTVGEVTLQITVGDLQLTIPITVKEGVSVNSDVNENYKGYPNPCTNAYNIQANRDVNDLEGIKIYNSAGQLVDNYSINSIDEENNTITINTQNLDNGVYVYSLVFAGETINSKFIKK